MPAIELLAPAKNLACAIAAIDAGADAIYIGAEKHGARSKAGNSIEDIQQAVEYAHKYWAKVYVAFNTILKDEELEEASSLIQQLAKIGIDGLIIQDFALIELAPKSLPIIASTQMHNNTLEKLGFLQAANFKRVILPREFSLAETKAAHQKYPDLELECFVHGALCVCYSGQCYLSYSMGGRSANRGDCAQACRETYDLFIDGNLAGAKKHFLSLRDLNLSEDLGALLDAGITSFKIEGRLKDIDYVTNIVAYYRQRLDQEMKPRKLQCSSSGQAKPSFTPNPEKSFSRGTTDYFLNKREVMSNLKSPKSLGEKVGKVTWVDRNYFELDQGNLHNADGICFYGYDQLLGTNINEVSGTRVYPQNMSGLQVGTEIYRNHDHVFQKELAKGSSRKIFVNMDLKLSPLGLSLAVSDENKNMITAALAGSFEVSQNPDKNLETIKKQLSKTGDTIFTANNIEIDGNYFVPISALNQLRRDALSQLSAERQRNYPAPAAREITHPEYPTKYLDFSSNIANQEAADFLYKCGVKKIDEAAELGRSLHKEKVMTTKYCLAHELGKCGQQQGEWVLKNRFEQNLILKFDCAKCQMEVWLD